MPEKGIFTISLDFELYWGIRDKRTLEQYGENLRGVRHAAKAMLSTFTAYDVHVTWATVGFLFFENANELKQNFPSVLPEYANPTLSPYRYINEHEGLDKTCHFAPDIIELVRDHRGQEIGTHTFSHYYCLEDGQDINSFREDLSSAIKVAKKIGVSLNSLVFPKNQWTTAYLPVLEELGIKAYRGNEVSSFYGATNEEGQDLFRRGVRLLDAYLNLTGYHTYSLDQCMKQRPFNIPSSRFLRPYSRKMAFLDGLRLHRIKRAMEDAAVNHKVFHLWWHPHNFGIHTEQNISFLKKILDHFLILKKRFGMESLNMGELSSYLDEKCVAR